MKIISWNINGFNKTSMPDIQKLVSSNEYDAILLQEIKSPNVPLTLITSGYVINKFNSNKVNYSGVLSATKEKPMSVIKGMGIKEYDDEGRVLTLEFKYLYIINVYFPFAMKPERQEFKLRLLDDFVRFCEALGAKKPVLICGDINIAHKEIDIVRGTPDTPGCIPKEREWLSKFLDSGFVDAFRFFNKDKVKYSGFRYYNKDQGERFDYFLVPKELIGRAKNSEIMDNVPSLDHLPITLEMG
jgi:exodeoxyribonuclease-3